MEETLQTKAEKIHENFMEMYHSCVIAVEESFPTHDNATMKLMNCLYDETTHMVQVFHDILHEYINEVRHSYQQGTLFDD